MSPDHKLVTEILRAGARLTHARNALLVGFGTTSARLRLLKAIHRLPIAFTVSELARALNVSRQTLQPMIHELEAAGLIYIRPNARHVRASVISLSTLGEATLGQMVKVEQRWIADLTRGYNSHLLAQTEWVIRRVRERASE